jgi:hypothetical protein
MTTTIMTTTITTTTTVAGARDGTCIQIAPLMGGEKIN